MGDTEHAEMENAGFDIEAEVDRLERRRDLREAQNHIYFIQGAGGGPIKIGKASNVAQRLAALQACSPVQLLVLATMKAPPSMETKLHQEFAAHRLHGEWFQPVGAVLERIEEVLAQPGDTATGADLRAMAARLRALADHFESQSRRLA